MAATVAASSFTRRAVLGSGLGALAAPAFAAETPSNALWVPGYDAGKAIFDGVPARDHPRIGRAVPEGYKGPVTLLTRIDLATGRADHAAYPVQGHVVALDRASGIGVLHAQSRDWNIAFDMDSLDMLAASSPFKGNHTGGGHAEFIRDGAILLTAERAAYGPYLGAPDLHHGRIAIREPSTLREIGQISSHGIGPHDIQLLDDGKTLAIANYGTVSPHRCGDQSDPGIEPSLTLVELESGKLVERFAVGDPAHQIRHFAVSGLGRVLAIQVREDSQTALTEALGGVRAEPDLTAIRGCAYLPAPMLSVRLGHQGVPPEMIEADNPALMRQGLSILHEPRHGQFIASFPSAHCLIICDDADGSIVRIVDTRALGLEYPCGVALAPDGAHYLVAGSFGPIRAFETGTHRHLPEKDLDMALHRHSHIKIS